MSTSGSSGWPTNGTPSGLEDQNTGAANPPPSSGNGPPGSSPGSRPLNHLPDRPLFFLQEGAGTDERAFRWALYYADRQAAVAYWWGLGAGLALGVLVGSFAAGATLVAALFHGR